MTELTTPEAAADAARSFQAPAFNEAEVPVTDNAAEPRPNLDVIMDVPVTLSLEVGRAQMNVGKLLRLTPGSVVELDRNAGDPLDVYVNGTLVAHGEIVVINDKFGIRLTDVLSPGQRPAGAR